jgi:hypothetical protein
MAKQNSKTLEVIPRPIRRKAVTMSTMVGMKPCEVSQWGNPVTPAGIYTEPAFVNLNADLQYDGKFLPLVQLSLRRWFSSASPLLVIAPWAWPWGMHVMLNFSICLTLSAVVPRVN